MAENGTNAGNTQAGAKPAAPKALTSMMMGICSCALGCSIIGLVLGIIALVMQKNGKAEYDQNPDAYTNQTGMYKAAKITGIIGIVIGSLSLFYLLLYGTAMVKNYI